MTNTLLTTGLACVVAAIVGGGLKAFGIQIPVLSSRRRQGVLGLFGIVLVALAFTTPPDTNPPASQPSSPQLADSEYPPPRPVPTSRAAGPVSQLIAVPLPGQPTSYANGSDDAHLREARQIFASVGNRKGVVLDRIEVITWLNLDKPAALQTAEQLMWELSQRGYGYNYSPSDMGPLDSRRNAFWVEVFDLNVFRSDQSLVGYWGLGYSGEGKYALVWAWALLP